MRWTILSFVDKQNFRNSNYLLRRHNLSSQISQIHAHPHFINLIRSRKWKLQPIIIDSSSRARKNGEPKNIRATSLHNGLRIAGIFGIFFINPSMTWSGRSKREVFGFYLRLFRKCSTSDRVSRAHYVDTFITSSVLKACLEPFIQLPCCVINGITFCSFFLSCRCQSQSGAKKIMRKAIKAKLASFVRIAGFTIAIWSFGPKMESRISLESIRVKNKKMRSDGFRCRTDITRKILLLHLQTLRRIRWKRNGKSEVKWKVFLSTKSKQSRVGVCWGRHTRRWFMGWWNYKVCTDDNPTTNDYSSRNTNESDSKQRK